MPRLNALLAALALASCGPLDADEAENATTTQQAVEMEIPGTGPTLAVTVTPALDRIRANPAPRSEERWYAPAFPLPPGPH